MKIRKGMNPSFVLVPIAMITIGLTIFYISYTIKDVNATKKVLQEAAYSGALAGSMALDISNFEQGKEKGKDMQNDYPCNVEDGNPIAFMIQEDAKVRKGNKISDNDCLQGEYAIPYTENTKNLAAIEAVQTVNEYLKNALKIDMSNPNQSALNSKTYTAGDYSIAIKFSRDEIQYGGVKENPNEATGPFNKIEVSVSLNYKPIINKGLFKDSDGNPTTIPIYGTSSAKTKTIS